MNTTYILGGLFAVSTIAAIYYMMQAKKNAEALKAAQDAAKAAQAQAIAAAAANAVNG